MTATLDAAHDYIRRGWKIVPLHGWNPDTGECRCTAGRFCPEKNRGKHPSRGRAWQNNTLDSGADVEAWYSDHAHDNIGILTGPRSGVFVFDVDGATGIRSVTDLATENGPLPATRIVRTGSGGLHYFFRHPGHFTIRNSTSWIAPGIDIRGENGQVVAPPSVSGRGPYEVIADQAVAVAPDWLLELLAEHSRNYEAGRTTEAKTAERVDMALVPESIRIAATTLVGEDQGRFGHFHGIVAACHEAGFTQGQTVTIVAPWCTAVGKFVGRVEAEVARSWGKIQAAKQKQNDWLPDNNPTRPETDGTAALAPVPAPSPAPTQPDAAANDDTTGENLTAPDITPTWRPVDLEPILTGTYQPETPSLYPRTDDACLVYAGRVHSFHGESESGKSLVVQAEAARLCKNGDDVLYIDFESDAAAVTSRLLDMGVQPDQIRAHFTYLRPDNDPRKFPYEREEFAQLVTRTYALAVIDGMTDALGTFGASSKDNDEIAAFMRTFPRLIATRTGAAVIVIDHVTKDADSRGRFALGGQAKMNALDGSAFVVEVAEPLGRGMRGTVVLRVAKDRPGGVRPHSGPFRKLDRTQEAARVVVDSTAGFIDVTVQAPHATVDSDPKAARTFRPTIYMQRVSEFLEHASGAVSGTVLVEGVTGKAEMVRQAAALLVAEGFVTDSGSGQRHSYTSEKPYYADEDPESETYIGWASEGSESGSDEGQAVPRPNPVPTPSRRGSDDPVPRPSSPTGEGRGSTATKDGQAVPTPSQPERPFAELDCNGCGATKPAVVINAFKGLCAECARTR